MASIPIRALHLQHPHLSIRIYLKLHANIPLSIRLPARYIAIANMSLESSNIDADTPSRPENLEVDADYSIWIRAIEIIQGEIDRIDKYRQQAIDSPLLEHLARLRGSIIRVFDDYVEAKDSEIDVAVYKFPATLLAAGPGSNPFYKYLLTDVEKDLIYTLKALEHIHEIGRFMAIDPSAQPSDRQTDSKSGDPEPDQVDIKSHSEIHKDIRRLVDIAVPQRFCMFSEIMKAWTVEPLHSSDTRTAFARDNASSLCTKDFPWPDSMTDLRNNLSHSFAYSLDHKATVDTVFKYCREIFPSYRHQLRGILNQIIEAYPYLIRKRIAMCCKSDIENRFEPKVKAPWEIIAEMPDEEVFVPVVPVQPNDDDEQVHEEAPEAEQSLANEPFSETNARQRLEDTEYYALEIMNRHNGAEEVEDLPWEDICDLQKILALCKVTEPDSGASL